MAKTNKKYEGKAENLSQSKTFYMVVVEGSHTAPTKQHQEYDDAFAEALRLAKKENRRTLILQAVTEVELIANVKQLK